MIRLGVRVHAIRRIRESSLLTPECLEIAQPFSSSRHAFARGRIKQHARLIAILGNAISLQIQIGQKQSRLAVVFGDGFPEPLGGFGTVAPLPAYTS